MRGPCSSTVFPANIMGALKDIHMMYHTTQPPFLLKVSKNYSSPPPPKTLLCENIFFILKGQNKRGVSFETKFLRFSFQH